MFKILGSTVALAVFALPLIPQAVFSQQATTQPSPTSNNSVTGATPVTGTTPVTGVNNPGNQNLVNSGSGATGTVNQPLNQNQTSGSAQGNAASTTTISVGGVLNLSTATSDRPTASNNRNAQNTSGVGNQTAANTNNVLNNIQPTNSVNGNNPANQGVQNSENNQAFVVRGTLDAPLRQAVCAQNWQQATGIVNRAIAAAPATATQYRGQLESYREQLQTLQAANVRVPNWQQQCGG